MPYNNQTNNYQISRYIVDADGTTPFATVQSAITQAVADGATNATIEIRPGTYTENLVLVDNINLTGCSDAIGTGTAAIYQIIIDGIHTPPAAGQIAFSNLKFASTTDILFSAAAGTCNIGFYNCIFAADLGFTCNLANWTGDITIESCSDISTSNGIVFNTTSCAVDIIDSQIGSGVVGASFSGVTRIFNSRIFCPISFAGTVAARIENSSLEGLMTIADPADIGIYNSRIVTTTAAITTTSTQPVILANVEIDSPINPCITGVAGQVELGEVVFINDNHIAGTVVVTQATECRVSNLTSTNNISLPAGQFVIQASSGTNGQLPIAATGGDLAWGSLTSTDGSVTFTTGANTLDLSSHAGDAWTAVAADGVLVNNQAVYNTKVALLTMALPAVAPAGSYIKLAGTAAGAGGWIITTGLGQNIQCGATSAATSVASSDDNDVISLVCVVANTTWQMVYSVGNLTIV